MSNYGNTAEEAVTKMLVRLEIVEGCSNCFHIDVDHVDGGCIRCQCVKGK